MISQQRRRLLVAALAATAVPVRTMAGAPASPSARVAIVGGGFAGATCARLLRRLAPSIEVTLIEPRREFFTGPSTNAAIASLCAEGDIVRGPARLVDIGVNWRPTRAVAIDPVARTVRCEDGATIEADRLVVCPGIAMRWDRIDGLDATTSDAMPHAWLGDAQVSRLRERVAALRDGATVAISAPANPYRCPPGPYERASLIAWRLTAMGRKRCRILLLDGKDDFTKRPLFQLGWDTLYPGTIEWTPRAAGGEVLAVDARRGNLHLQNGSVVHAVLASVIPPQAAGTIAHDADLTDETGWCPVSPATFESARHSGVHVIGDAAAAQPMPKSAFSANSQAKLAALSIVASLEGRALPDPKLVNTCYSLLAPDYAISVGALYGVADGRLSVLSDGMSALGASREVRAQEARYEAAWYRSITREAWG